MRTKQPNESAWEMKIPRCYCVTFKPAHFLELRYHNDVLKVVTALILHLSQRWLYNTKSVTLEMYLYLFALPKGYSKQVQRCHTVTFCQISNGIVKKIIDKNFWCCRDNVCLVPHTKERLLKKSLQHCRKPVLNKTILCFSCHTLKRALLKNGIETPFSS